MNKILFPLALLLCACSSNPAGQFHTIQDADAATVQSCRMLGVVTGSSIVTYNDPAVALERALMQARSYAARLGATHIVWTREMTGYSASVTGRAFTCHP